MRKLYVKRNYLLKQRDKKIKEVERIRKELKELNQLIFLKEGENERK